MKKLLTVLSCLFLCLAVYSQDTYTIEGESLELKTEVSGELTLLYNIIDDSYRYFVKKGNEIVELKNTRGSDNKFQEEYKSVLANLTSDSDLSTNRLKLTLFSLSEFIKSYNNKDNPGYNVKDERAGNQSRLLIFGGITNSPFVENDQNTKNPVFGAEIEFLGVGIGKRHALLFQLKHSASSDDFKYQNTQFGLGYRFRFIDQEAVNVYATVLGATFGISQNERVFDGETFEESGEAFDAPFIFGVGADIKISDTLFISLIYDELFAIFLDNQGNFSTNIMTGLKIKL